MPLTDDELTTRAEELKDRLLGSSDPYSLSNADGTWETPAAYAVQTILAALQAVREESAAALREALAAKQDTSWKARAERAEATIARATAQIENSYETSEVGRANEGFQSKLENYIHQIHKREPSVAAAESRLRAVEQALREHGRHPASCPKGVGVGYYKPPADAECHCGIDAALLPGETRTTL